MSTSASVVFSTFSSGCDPRLQGWLSFRGQLQLGDAAPERRVSGAVNAGNPWSARSGIWRLLASNSRELGRSSSVYSSFDVARAHVLALQARVDEMAVTTVTGPSSGTHGWLVTVDGLPVMTSGRWYGTTSTTRDACAGALAALRTAVVTTDARLMLEPGARRPRRPRQPGADAELAGTR